MKMLRSKLYEAEREEKDLARASNRKTQVGSGDRSERIRTYNYPQGRITDHRINLTLYKLDKALEGYLDELINALGNSRSNIVLVSGEVGTGIVPDNALAREFRDNAGLMNQKIASVSDQVYWVVAGIPTQIK